MIDTILDTTLNHAISTSVLIVVVLLVNLCIRHPGIRYALWLMVLLKFITPPIWQITVGSSRIMGEALPPEQVVPQSAIPEVLSSTFPTSTEPAEFFDWQADWEELETLPAGATASEPKIAHLVPEIAPNQVASATKMSDISWKNSLAGAKKILLVVWGLGSLALIWQVFIRRRKMNLMLKMAGEASGFVQQIAASVAQQLKLKHLPKIILSPGNITPALYSPSPRGKDCALLLPMQLVQTLPVQQLKVIIAHELVHFQRKDYLVRWLELCVQTMFWWHPLLVWVRTQLRQNEEAICDLQVVHIFGCRTVYATAILESASFAGNGGLSHAMVSGFGTVSNLRRRIKMVMKGNWKGKMSRWTFATICTVGLIGFSSNLQLAGDEPGKKGDRPAPREGDRPGNPDRPRDGDRPNPERPRDGDRPNPERPRDGEKPVPDLNLSPVQLQKLRAELEAARARAAEAMAQVREIESLLMRAQGLPPRGERPREGDRPGNLERPRDGDRPNPERPREGDRPGIGNLRVPNPPIADLQRQMEEMRRSMEEMRRMMEEFRRGVRPPEKK